ncbi:unnamed protein product [Zymoseptoria tritici ST99CH_3D7]|uniref:Uncharacterized protein n=1 Tax=Zymoseptoria tritici (strain ST99CH_3D7) TaxID=1276538 RepID=A0A1X7S8N8_ZYMT9|nr:unnamed protein product [Zymoseptoria tritici ST99CH_3D7]
MILLDRLSKASLTKSTAMAEQNVYHSLTGILLFLLKMRFASILGGMALAAMSVSAMPALAPKEQTQDLAERQLEIVAGVAATVKAEVDATVNLSGINIEAGVSGELDACIEILIEIGNLFADIEIAIGGVAEITALAGLAVELDVDLRVQIQALIHLCLELEAKIRVLGIVEIDVGLLLELTAQLQALLEVHIHVGTITGIEIKVWLEACIHIIAEITGHINIGIGFGNVGNGADIDIKAELDVGVVFAIGFGLIGGTAPSYPPNQVDNGSPPGYALPSVNGPPPGNN